MSAPKCRLCGYYHWGNDHTFPDDPKPKKPKSSNGLREQSASKPIEKPEPKESDPDKKQEPERSNVKQPNGTGLESPEKASARAIQWQKDNRKRYNEYMRGYMQRKRKQAREQRGD